MSNNFFESGAIFWLIVVIIISLTNVADGYPSGESFDFVVVGGGTAGCTVASRLSENGRFSVLLVESGGFPHSGLDIPQVGPQFTGNGEHAKFYQMQLTSERNASYLTGKTLGGGSSINGMVFNRGSPHDWNKWAELTGDSSWKYDNMLKYFKKVEKYLGDFPSNQQHGHSGHITVSTPKYAPGMETILEAGRSLGYPVTGPNGPQEVSFTPIEFSKRWGRRVSSFTGYLKPYLGFRRNLKVVTGANVETILFDHRSGQIKAIGIVYSSGSRSHFVRVTKEVIVSCGVIESAALLMRSGIGPRDNLEASRIPVIKELPVGKFIQDHPVLRLQFMINDSTPVLLPERDVTPENYLKFNQSGEGPYSTHDADNALAFMASSLSSRKDWPDLQIQFVSSGLSSPPPEDILPGEVTVSCMLYLTRPKSRGRLILNSTNIKNDPIFNFNYFQHSQDMDIILDGIQRALQVYEKTPAFQKIGARYSTMPIEECRGIPFRSREYWRCYVRNRFLSGLHGVGSCRMGNPNSTDAEAVVDSNLRVIGVQGLRVVDASIMPQVTNANTQAPVYAIAEKGSELILQRWDDTNDARRFTKFPLRFKG